MSRSDRIMLATAGGALVLVAAAAWMLLAPSVGAPPMDTTTTFFANSSGAPTPAASAARPGTIVVDVQGGVARPGIRELPAGSRVADAIDAAGGYGVDADLEAAASINLAATLADGDQVRIPRIGDSATGGAATPGAPTAGTTGAAGGGPVNLNTATPEELEALPGIGPVTVQKIVAARAERPFASLEEAVERGIINRGQLEDLQGVATAG